VVGIGKSGKGGRCNEVRERERPKNAVQVEKVSSSVLSRGESGRLRERKKEILKKGCKKKKKKS